MIRKSFLTVLASLTILAGCVTTMGYEDHEAFKPKLQETGGPKELYSIRSEQITGMFTPGTMKEQILQRYGKPTLAGTGVDKEGKPNSWAVYTYFRGYSYIDTNLNSLFVNRSTSATLSFDSTEKLIDVSFSRFQKFVQGKSDRDATDEEVARFLGAPQALDIKPAATVAGKGTGAAPAAAIPAGGWKLGADISELRSELATRTGYKGRGVYVVSVDPQGLAARAGIAAGDVIVKANGAATPTRDDLIEQLKAASTASALNLQIFSQGRVRNVSIPAQQAGGGTTSI